MYKKIRSSITLVCVFAMFGCSDHGTELDSKKESPGFKVLSQDDWSVAEKIEHINPITKTALYKRYATDYIEQLNANMPPNSNAAKIARLYTENAKMIHGFDEHEATGRSEIEALYLNLVQQYKYKRHEVVRITVEENKAIIEAWNIDKPKNSILERKSPIIFSIEFDGNGLVNRQNVFIVRT